MLVILKKVGILGKKNYKTYLYTVSLLQESSKA